MRISEEQKIGLKTFVDQVGLAAVTAALSEIAQQEGQHAASSYLKAVALALEPIRIEAVA